MNNNVREWYLTECGHDSFGDNIDTRLTWKDLDETLERRGDIYLALGVEDSTIRERVLQELARRLGESYDTIYGKWLKGYLMGG